MSRRPQPPAPMIRSMFSGAKNSATGTVPAISAEEAAGLHLVAAEGAEERCISGGGGCERGSSQRHLVDRHHGLVALALVAGERLLERPAAAEARVDRVGEQLGVAERVGDALGR